MPKDAVDTRKLKDSVAEYLKKSKLDKAAELLEELADAEPKDVQHRLRLGDCYRRLGETVKSILNYDIAARQFADDGHLIKAIAAVKVILEIDPDNKDAQRQLAQMNERRLGKTDAEPVSRGAEPSEAKASGAAKIVEPIELPEETEVTEPVAKAPTRGAQRGAMADRIQIELEPDDGTPLELEGVPKLTSSVTEPILAASSPELERTEKTGREPIQDLPDDAILDPEPLPPPPAAAPKPLRPAPATAPETLPPAAAAAPEPFPPAPAARSARPRIPKDAILDPEPLRPASALASPPSPSAKPRATAEEDESLDALGSLADLLAPEAEEEIELLSISTDPPPRKQ